MARSVCAEVVVIRSVCAEVVVIRSVCAEAVQCGECGAPVTCEPAVSKTAPHLYVCTQAQEEPVKAPKQVQAFWSFLYHLQTAISRLIKVWEWQSSGGVKHLRLHCFNATGL